MDPHQEQTPQLDRVLNLPMLTLYGLGTTVGAGIYALVGEIAGVAGYGAPLSFLGASLVAGFTACSFAELSSRFPRAAGAALYVEQGFGAKRLSMIVGLLVALSGVVSSAALVNGFTGYLLDAVEFDRIWIIAIVTLSVGALASWGIAESVAVAAIITIVEVGGLLWVVWVGADEFATLPDRWTQFVPIWDIGVGNTGVGNTGVGNIGDGVSWTAALMGVPLAFYAFIGFEDMVDVAEEVKDVRKNMPRAILLTLVISTSIYLLLVVSALLSVHPQELAASNAPLVKLYEVHTGESSIVIGLIAMFAIINGALVQTVMASRVLYGLSSRGQLPSLLGRVNAFTRTPLVATAIVALVLLVLSLYGRLAGLANVTSLILLAIFALVNLALWRVKKASPVPEAGYEFPRFFPLVGFALCGLFFVRALLSLVEGVAP